MIDGYPDVKQRRLAVVEGNTLKSISEKEIGGKMAALFEMRDQHILDYWMKSVVYQFLLLIRSTSYKAKV